MSLMFWMLDPPHFRVEGLAERVLGGATDAYRAAPVYDVEVDTGSRDPVERAG
jgi:hypothetical protein